MDKLVYETINFHREIISRINDIDVRSTRRKSNIQLIRHIIIYNDTNLNINYFNYNLIISECIY